MLLARLTRAHGWIVALVMIGALARFAHARPSSEAPILLAMVALSTLLPRRPRWRLPFVGSIARHRELVACGIVTTLALATFGPIVRMGDAGRHADWSQNVAVVDEIVREWSHGRPTPTVFLGVASGDPTSDLYATLVHRLAAFITLALGDPSRSLQVTTSIALFAWILAATGVTRLALRFSSWPIAVLAGIACLFDSTTMFTWGVAATWHWGLFPSTCAIALVVSGLPTFVDLFTSPPTRTRILIVWGLLGLGALVHPIGLLFDVVVVVAAGICTAFARSDRRVRWAVATLHASLAVGLVAFAWLPLTARLTLYAAHFGTPQIPVPLAIDRSVTGLLPETAFGTLMSVSVFTLLSGKRAAMFTWIAAWVMLSLYLEPLFLDLGFAPTPTSVRLQCFRTTSVAMPLLYAASGALLSAPASVPSGRYARFTRWVPALACIAALAWLGAAPLEAARTWAMTHARRQLDVVAEPRIGNRPALDALVAFFRSEASSITPGSYARVAYEWNGDPINEVLRVFSEAHVPVTAHGPFVPVFVAREQIHDITPENFRRWGIRWSIGGDQVAAHGDPATDRTFGILHVQDVPTWDGRIVHVVRGEGDAELAEIDDAHLTIDVTGTQPVLVEIGVPYYPRWRGVHEGQTVTPCARPIDPSDPTQQRVLAAWLAPGRTVLRPNGALPSDPIGWPLTLIAAGVAFASWPRRRADAISSRVARLRAVLRPLITKWSGLALASVMLVTFIVMPARQGAFGGTARSLRYGGMFPAAQMELVTAEGRLRCEPRDLLGHEVRCARGVRATMVTTHSVYDAPVGWPAPLPGISINAGGNFELSIHAPGTWAAGDYHLFCGGACANVAIMYDGHEHTLAPGVTQHFTIEHTQEGLDVLVRGNGGDTPITLVRADAIDVDRHHDVPFCGDVP